MSEKISEHGSILKKWKQRIGVPDIFQSYAKNRLTISQMSVQQGPQFKIIKNVPKLMIKRKGEVAIRPYFKVSIKPHFLTGQPWYIKPHFQKASLF